MKDVGQLPGKEERWQDLTSGLFPKNRCLQNLMPFYLNVLCSLMEFRILGKINGTLIIGTEIHGSIFAVM